MLGLGMFFWLLFQVFFGMVYSFIQFVLVCIGMGIGEVLMNFCGVKVINDWFNIKECGCLMGFFNVVLMIGVVVSLLIFVVMMLMMGWCWMFIIIGILGIFIVIGWYMFYCNWEDFFFIVDEQVYFNVGSVNVCCDLLSFVEWCSLFKNKIMWGMMFGFSGINYIVWLYLVWLLGYL